MAPTPKPVLNTSNRDTRTRGESAQTTERDRARAPHLPLPEARHRHEEILHGLGDILPQPQASHSSLRLNLRRAAVILRRGRQLLLALEGCGHPPRCPPRAAACILVTASCSSLVCFSSFFVCDTLRPELPRESDCTFNAAASSFSFCAAAASASFAALPFLLPRGVLFTLLLIQPIAT